MALPRCPVCNVDVDPKTSPAMPFCSDRCRNVDLGRWLTEDYGVPYEGEAEDEQIKPEEMN